MGEIDITALFVAVPIVFLTVTFILVAYEDYTPDPDRLEKGDLGATLKLFTPLGWVLTVGLSVAFLVTGLHIITGIPEVQPIEAVLSRFEYWGYSQNFEIFIGTSQIFAAILLIPPQTSSWVAAYLAIMMGGSIYTHIAAGDWLLAAIPLLFLAALVYIAAHRFPWAAGRRLLTTHRRSEAPA